MSLTTIYFLICILFKTPQINHMYFFPYCYALGTVTRSWLYTVARQFQFLNYDDHLFTLHSQQQPCSRYDQVTLIEQYRKQCQVSQQTICFPIKLEKREDRGRLSKVTSMKNTMMTKSWAEKHGVRMEHIYQALGAECMTASEANCTGD